eukprot:CAMPEP_0181322698 /NCGR_PEP_ID=MMETSP1101-20121128/19368_1 /TAXON_ID=46948 /ORGANISM="Rhodomonas abbreviata, Strain Caron Lab Isolate" /LENGTH=315 /DNA_ID=CAMNT_0023430631 /DNA_START=271 /DNA_END=1214 /DNA_ORIENTATION=-
MSVGTKEEGLTPMLGTLEDLTIAGDPGSGGPPAASLYPALGQDVRDSSLASTNAGGAKIKCKCLGCKRSIRHDHLQAAVKCECPLEPESGESTTLVMHQACRDLLLQSLAAESGFVTADGKGDTKHPEFVLRLKSPMPYFIETDKGLVSGYLVGASMLCQRCISAVHTPCASRALFDRVGGDETSSDEEKGDVREETFTTVMSAAESSSKAAIASGEALPGPPPRKATEEAGARGTESQNPKLSKDPSPSGPGTGPGAGKQVVKDNLAPSTGKAGHDVLTVKDFAFIALICRQAAAGDGTLCGVQAVMIARVRVG